MHTVDSIKDKFKQLGISTMMLGGNIKWLQTLLTPNEQIEAAVSGTYSKQIGVLTLTNRRLIFSTSFMFNNKSEDYMLKNVSSITCESLVFGKVLVHGMGNISEITQCSTKEADAFVALVRSRMSNSETPQQSTNSSNDMLDRLAKLGDLKASGILTEEEFQTQKAKLLNA